MGSVSAGSALRRAAMAVAASAALGCEPQFDVDGAFFPAWIVCMAAGLVLSAIANRVFVRAGIDAHLGHPALVYPALYVLLTLLTWIGFFRT